MTGAAALWVALWFSIDTGPWVLRRMPSGPMEAAHFMRTLFPLIALVAPVVLVRTYRGLPPLTGPVALWLAYGLVALMASLNSPRSIPDTLYWAGAYLGVFSGLAIYLSGPDPLERARQLNHLNWIVATIFLAIIAFVARDYLIVGGQSAYGIRSAVAPTDALGGVSIPRSTGVARFAAIPGILGFTLLLAACGWQWRAAGIALFVPATALIYLFQARTATFGFAAALALVMLFHSQRTRMAGIALGVAVAILSLHELVPQEHVDRFLEQAFRGDPGSDSVRTFGGRWQWWEAALEASWQSPLWGFGHMTDRELIGRLVHSTHLYALLTAGWIGVLLFVGGLLWAWALFARIIGHVRHLGPAHHLTTVQVGAILTFFTLRSVTEISGVSFSIDTLVLVPALAYLTLADRALRPSGASALRHPLA